MSASIVMAIIALVVAIVAMCIAMNQKVSNDKPSSEEGRKVAIVRGTAWVKSTQITVWTDTYTTGG